jgi:hypothetical protein
LNWLILFGKILICDDCSLRIKIAKNYAGLEYLIASFKRVEYQMFLMSDLESSSSAKHRKHVLD